ncbi:hypothetical protein [Sphingosinicella sp. LY1275]|uniref:hypothetical protein n=1 Tax=Sphingosinicella sp. LY1275 TaxID=3095379 RepID=UPI002ADEEF74|nr:hypothetical protein [Sphingosinicella sp. LY1275]MEA1015275.1 hypothetical protein [Sphingosinicella sp. LY1275]
MPEALPALGPAAMRIYVAIWSVLLVAAIVLAAVGVHYGLEPHRNPTWSALGITVLDRPGGATVVDVVGSEARAKDVKPGDAVLAVDGRRVPSGSGAAASAGRWVLGPDGTVKKLTLRTGADARDVTLTRSRDAREQYFRDAGISSLALYGLSAAFDLAGALMLIASAILLFRQRRQPVAALLSMGFVAMAATMTAGSWLLLVSLGLATLVAPMSTLGWTATLLAVMTMPDGRFALRWTLWLAVALLMFDALFLARTMPYWLSDALALTFTVGAVAAMGFRYRKLPRGPERQQLRWAFLGFATGAALMAASVSLDLIAPALKEADAHWGIWVQLGLALFYALGICAFALGLLVSLLRYRLYDADAVIGRSAGYALLTVLLAGAFGITAKLIEVFFETSFARDAGALPGAVGAGLVLTMIAPMHRRIHGWAERRFQKDILRLRRDLPPAVDDLRETASLDELLGETLGHVMRGTRATWAAVAIDGDIVARRGPKGDDCPTEVPLRIAHQNLSIGTLLVGRRPDFTPIGKDEREALATVADPVARAIRIVRVREAHIARGEERLAAIEDRLNVAVSS